jgi:hypothetical protein
VVSVSILLRRISVFGLMLSMPARFPHQQIEHLDEWLDLPPWSFSALGSVIIFPIGRWSLAKRAPITRSTSRHHELDRRHQSGFSGQKSP